MSENTTTTRTPPPPPKWDPRTVESLAGLSAGFLATLISHPLDFIKLKLQLDSTSKTQKMALLKVKSDLVSDSLTPQRSISYTQLIKNTYRGVGPNLLGSTTAWGLYFSFYREYKNLLLKSYNNSDAGTVSGSGGVRSSSSSSDHYLSTVDYLLCGFAAGWSTSIITNPIWVIKTRMITTSRTTEGSYKSIIDGVKQIYLKEGLKGYYRGLTPALFSVSQGAIQFSLYDTIKHHLIKKKPNEKFTTFEYLYASALSKMVSVVIFYPLQVVRTRMQANTGGTTSIITIVKNIINIETFAGFYKGVGANLIRVLPSTCVTFVVYENVRTWLL